MPTPPANGGTSGAHSEECAVTKTIRRGASGSGVTRGWAVEGGRGVGGVGQESVESRVKTSVEGEEEGFVCPVKRVL